MIFPDCARHDDEELEMYADDTTLTSIGETVDQVILKLNETLGLVSEWCYKPMSSHTLGNATPNPAPSVDPTHWRFGAWIGGYRFCGIRLEEDVEP